MWHKAIWKGHPMRLELTRVGLLVELANHYTTSDWYRSSKVSYCIFEIHHLWQPGFSRVYSNCCCCCSLEPEIRKIGQSSHKMYSKNIMNFQASTTTLNACTKKSGNLLNAPRFPIRVRVDLGVIAVKWYFTLPNVLELEPQNQIQFYGYKQDTFFFSM